MDTQTVMRSKFYRSYENFIEELCRETDLAENMPAEYGRQTQALGLASVWEDRSEAGKAGTPSAFWGKNRYAREAALRNSAGYRASQGKDLFLLGLFCLCLLAVNLVCWSFPG
jgi:hypothetical protein